MLSPSTSAQAPSPTNRRPMMNACASPSGDGCTAYDRWIPHCVPSPSSCVKRGVTSVMPRAILDKADLRRVVATGLELAQDPAQAAHHVDVGHLGATADVVRFARLCALEHGADRSAVVADVEPVANVQPVAVYW